MTPEHRERLTFQMERLRAFGMGVLETASATFLLLIAHRIFSAGPATKAIIQGSGSLGLLLSPIAVLWAAHRNLHAGTAAARLFLFGAISLTLAARRRPVARSDRGP
ncbi:MAG: hypothetical protein ACK5CW_06810, partial [Verrucomicrobiota bacterium]